MYNMTYSLLIIDDSSACREILASILREDGYLVEMAGDAESGLAQLTRRQPDLILLDIASPGCDGHDLLAHLQSDATTADIPVIVVTRSKNEEDIARAFAAGAKDLITKPLSPAVVRVRVKSVLAVRRLHDELKRSRHAGQTGTQTKSDFIAKVSHEIRTPLTAMLGYIEIMQQDNASLPSGHLESLEVISRNGRHLLDLINDVLDLSKIEADKIELESIWCSPHQILQEAGSLLQLRAETKGISLRVEFDGGLPESIESDPTRIKQIVVNLLGNAIKFTSAGEVRMVARTVTDNRPAAPEDLKFLEIEVIDSGIGMSQAQIATLFQPFSQASLSTTRQYGGTGLGLSITRQLVDLLGGQITVSSVVGQGSTFVVRLPVGTLDGIRLLDSVPMHRSDKSPEDKPANEAPLRNVRVLVADDGPDNRRLISYVLSRAGAEVVAVENGQEAIEAVSAANANNLAVDARPFQVILMDVEMPVIDGIEATIQLRRQGLRIPIIAITAHALGETRESCLEAGCDTFIIKPFKLHDMVRQVADVVAESTPVTV